MARCYGSVSVVSNHYQTAIFDFCGMFISSSFTFLLFFSLLEHGWAPTMENYGKVSMGFGRNVFFTRCKHIYLSCIIGSARRAFWIRRSGKVFHLVGLVSLLSFKEASARGLGIGVSGGAIFFLSRVGRHGKSWCTLLVLNDPLFLANLVFHRYFWVLRAVLGWAGPSTFLAWRLGFLGQGLIQ